MVKYYFHTSQIDMKLDRNFFSCISGKVVPSNVWLSGEPKHKEICTAYTIDVKTSGLVTIPCLYPASLLCEVILIFFKIN